MPATLSVERGTPPRSRLLVVSNGHGEDLIGATVIAALRDLAAPALVIDAWPMVGSGEAYSAAGVTCIADGLRLPSEGFGTLSVRAFTRDVRAGWVRGHLRQMQLAYSLRGRYALVLAVGDLVPMLAACAAATPFAFVGCAKSVYYGRAGAYTSLERWLLRRHAVACYPRDQPTTDALVRHGIPARYLGNPMMDRVAPSGITLEWRADEAVVAVLPGSRRDREANAVRVLQMIAHARECYRDVARVHFAFVVTTGFDREVVRTCATHEAVDREARWTLAPDGDGLVLGEMRATFTVGGFGDVLPRARVAIALAGTANEQAVGVGTPIVTFATNGAQGEAYLRMKMPYFGTSAIRVAPEATAVANAVVRLIRDDVLHARMQRAGRERMGRPGGARAIAGEVLSAVTRVDSP
ncbi:MAG: lipid-A-disaccharide synthase-related protein [Gemmatimonadota bacterium]